MITSYKNEEFREERSKRIRVSSEFFPYLNCGDTVVSKPQQIVNKNLDNVDQVTWITTTF